MTVDVKMATDWNADKSKGIRFISIGLTNERISFDVSEKSLQLVDTSDIDEENPKLVALRKAFKGFVKEHVDKVFAMNGNSHLSKLFEALAYEFEPYNCQTITLDL